MSDQPNSYEEEVNLEEMRRGLAVQAAVALGLTSVDDLLDAATKIEAYLSGDSKPLDEAQKLWYTSIVNGGTRYSSSPAERVQELITYMYVGSKPTI